jgi:uncharacterized membrane protein YphA (DoxX/SURF4 family)
MAELGQELATSLAIAGRICVGLILLLAGIGKFRHWKILSGVIVNYRLLPGFAVEPAARLLPPLEVGLGLLLLSGLAGRPAALAGVLLLVVFGAAMAINLGRGRSSIDCGCGQSFLKQTLSWGLVGRNGVLAALLVASLGPSSAEISVPILAVGACAGIGFVLLYHLINTLAALPRPV